MPIFFSGCASSPDTAGKQENDPFESFNRQIYSFNEGADEYVIGPIAHAYRDIFPDPVRDSIRNFLLNLKTPMSAINATLQGDFGKGLSAVGRFTINSTVFRNITKKQNLSSSSYSFNIFSTSICFY